MELPSYFKRYLIAVQPSSYSRRRAIQLHTTLRERLASADNQTLQEWYSGNSFLYGSYARNTAVQPIKDVDICLLMDVAIDGYTPETVVRRLKKALEDLGYKDKTAYQRRSIRIDMSGTTMDAVPVVPIEGEQKILHIPDRKLKEWINTHPKAHMEAATRINKASGERYIPLVKIVKAWYRYQANEVRGIERPKPKGFTLEVLVANYQDPDAPTYAEAFVAFLQNLIDRCGTSLKQGTFPLVADPGLSGECLKLTFEPDEAKLFAAIIEESLVWAKQAMDAQTYGESARLWRQVFGDRFPDAPSAAKSLRFGEMDEDDQIFDPLTEAEISEVELPPISEPTKEVKLKVRLANTAGGILYQIYPTGSRAIAKGTWLQFSVDHTTVTPPYNIRWTVENHGQQARAADDMGHWRVTSADRPYQWERAFYRGSHHMICEIVKDGLIVARAKHAVNVR